MTNTHREPGTEAPGVTIREFAESMGVAYQTVQRWINPGGMPVLGWLEIGGRRFVRLDAERCRAWALASRPALAGRGPGGWRPGSGRTKRTAAAAGSASGQRPRQTAAAHADGRIGTFVPNTTEPQSSTPEGSPSPSAHLSTAPDATLPPSPPPPVPAPAPAPSNPYLEARTAALLVDVKVKELKYQQMAGKVVDKDEVTRVWTSTLHLIAASIDQIAPAAAREIARRLELDCDSHLLVEQAIEEQVARVRAAIADTGQSSPDLDGAAVADDPVA